MFSKEKDRAVEAAMIVARVRMRRIGKARDEAISKAFKGLFYYHLYPEIKENVFPNII